MAKMPRRRGAIQQADSALSMDAVRANNLEFYRHFRPEVITARLGLVSKLLGDPKGLNDELRSGIEITLPLDLSLKFSVSGDEQFGAQIVAGAAEAELLSLHQHTAETLFRLFYVHGRYAESRHNRRAPWLDLASLTESASSLASKYVDGELWADEELRRRIVSHTLYGEPVGEVKLSTRQVDVASSWVSYAASTIQRSDAYNAYKHGMAILSPLMGIDAEFVVTTKDGDSKTIPVQRGFYVVQPVMDEETRRYRWRKVFIPLDVPLQLTAVFFMVQMIQNILAVGEARVCPAPGECELKVALLVEMSAADLSAKWSASSAQPTPQWLG